MRKTRTVRFRRRDWLGPGFLTIFFGVVIALAEFLPWANAHGTGDVDFSLSKPDWVRSGFEVSASARPALIVGLAVVACGLLMVLLGPKRVSLWPGLLSFAAGLAAVVLAHQATLQIYFPVRAGLGLYLLMLAGVLLVPVGFAGAVVGYFMCREAAAGAR